MADDLSQAEVTTTAITALITSAVHDSSPRLTLAQVYCAVSNSGYTNLLDPLNVLPILLLSRDRAAGDFISLIGQCSSAKEVLIAVQEAVERIECTLLSEIEDNDHEKWQTPSAQLARLVSLYSSSIPRLKAGKKTPFEIVQPLLSQLESIIQVAAAQAQQDDGREIICSVSHLIQSVFGWLKGTGRSSDDDIRACQDILKLLLDSTIAAHASSINSSLAQRSFEHRFPRLMIRSQVKTGWEEDEKIVGEAKNALRALGVAPDDIPSKPTISTLIFLAHSPNLLPAYQLLPSLLPILLTSIQTNTALDESLSLLLTSLHSAQSESPRRDLSPDIIIPLFAVLPSLASAHPEPATRHLTFRILSLLLSLTPSSLRLQLLKDITSDSEFPQMCAAAVGLIKEAVLEALSPSASNQNVFASSLFLQVLGPVLFRPRPPDLFSESVSAQDFQKSFEPSRLVETLALYYILLIRDKDNQTGVRNLDTISNVERSLLSPLRLSLARWMKVEDMAHSHIEAIMPLASLQMGLERVDDAVSRLSPVRP